MKNLKDRWKLFLGLVFDPWNILLIIILVFLFSCSPKLAGDKARSLFNVFLTLASAVIGGKIIKQWLDVSEGRALVSKGKSAIRSLVLLVSNIQTLKGRVQVYLSRTKSNEPSVDTVKTHLEELYLKCDILQEVAVNAIEDWTDIIPEANVKPKIAVITDLKTQLGGKDVELENLKKKLSTTVDRSEDEIKELQEKIKELTADKERLQSELHERKATLDESLLSGLTGPVPGFISTPINTESIWPELLKEMPEIPEETPAEEEPQA